MTAYHSRYTHTDTRTHKHTYIHTYNQACSTGFRAGCGEEITAHLTEQWKDTQAQVHIVLHTQKPLGNKHIHVPAPPAASHTPEPGCRFFSLSISVLPAAHTLLQGPPLGSILLPSRLVSQHAARVGDHRLILPRWPRRLFWFRLFFLKKVFHLSTRLHTVCHVEKNKWSNHCARRLWMLTRTRLGRVTIKTVEKLRFKNVVCPVRLYLIDFVHPIAGKFKHQFAGLYCSRHGNGSSKVKEQPKISRWCLLQLLLCTDGLSFTSQNGSPVFPFSSLSSYGSERDHEPSFRGVLWPRWEQPRPSLTPRLGAAAPEASTPKKRERQSR